MGRNHYVCWLSQDIFAPKRPETHRWCILIQIVKNMTGNYPIITLQIPFQNSQRLPMNLCDCNQDEWLGRWVSQPTSSAWTYGKNIYTLICIVLHYESYMETFWLFNIAMENGPLILNVMICPPQLVIFLALLHYPRVGPRVQGTGLSQDESFVQSVPCGRQEEGRLVAAGYDV